MGSKYLVDFFEETKYQPDKNRPAITISGKLRTVEIECNDERLIPFALRDAGHKPNKILRSFEVIEETCDRCGGEGVIPPCCKGDVRNIECACHGEEKLCECDNGKIRIYMPVEK